MTSPFDARPVIVAIAGPNGAGKSTFFHAHLARAALHFLNADDLARELELDALDAAQLANRIRQSLVEQRESFIFETVLSDPVGDTPSSWSSLASTRTSLDSASPCASCRGDTMCPRRS